MPHLYSEQDWLGKTASRQVEITAELIDRYAELSGDRSPIHVDDVAARQRGLSGRVAHGMLIGSLVSGVIGNQLPGASGLLMEMQLSFRAPCHVGDVVNITVRADEFTESVQVLKCAVEVRTSEGRLLAKGSFHSGVQQGQ